MQAVCKTLACPESKLRCGPRGHAALQRKPHEQERCRLHASKLNLLICLSGRRCNVSGSTALAICSSTALSMVLGSPLLQMAARSKLCCSLPDEASIESQGHRFYRKLRWFVQWAHAKSFVRAKMNVALGCPP
eukprot:4850927-Amphidinium_carterae.1